MNVIEINNLNKEIKGNQILEDITLELEKGKVHGFWGRNGSGKTMLFRAICGLIKPTEGEVKVDGQTLHEDISFPSSVGVIIEGPGFMPQYSGYKNLKFLAAIKNQIDDKEIIENIKKVGLNPNDKRPVKKYSMGMKQRLAIAQAVMEKPELIIFDEPTNSLDEEGVEMFKEIVKEQNQRGATILIASHIKEDLIELCDSFYRMDHGKLQAVEVL